MIAKRSKQKIVIDSNVFLYVLLDQEPFSAHAKTLLKTIESSSSLEGVFSVLAFTEVLGEKASKQSLIGHQLLQELLNIRPAPVSEPIAKKAGRLRAQFPELRSADAIHLATAITLKSKLFITNDTKLKKIAQNLIPTKYLYDTVEL